MATTNPSYYQSGVCQDIRQKEHRFHLYMNERGEEAPDGGNQKTTVNSSLPHGFGHTVVNDWSIHDGPTANSNIVARARGMHLADGKADENWFLCHNILFTDSRFKGSSLKVIGDVFTAEGDEWAIVGGTGEFAYAQGIVKSKIIDPNFTTTGRVRELHIRAFCLCISDMTKVGPWGGEGGMVCDIPQPPLSLQTVTFRYGDVINSVAFSYTDQAGQKKTAGPWGGDGPLTTMITLAPSEVIKQVLGTTGIAGGDNVVTSVTLVSNLRTYGPFGKPNGTPFSSDVPDGKTITGFYARAGGAVNALGIYFT